MAASYGVGALGGLVYLRLLNRSVDSVGGGLGGALGQPRLLIPVILALGYNRCVCGAGEMEFVGTREGHGSCAGVPANPSRALLCRFNTLVGEETGLTLQLLPILLGFFTYKGAVIAKQSLVLFGELTGRQQAGGSSEGGPEAAADGGASPELDVASVDRAFRKKMLNEL